MSNLWYIRREGQAIGPFTTSEIKSQAINGTLTPGMKVRRADGTQWVAAEKLKGLVFTKLPQASVTPVTDSDGDSKISISDLLEVEFPLPSPAPPPLPYITQTASVPEVVSAAGSSSDTSDTDRRGFLAVCGAVIAATFTGIGLWFNKVQKSKAANKVFEALPDVAKFAANASDYWNTTSKKDALPEATILWGDATDYLIEEFQKLTKEEQDEVIAKSGLDKGLDLYCVQIKFSNVGKKSLQVNPQKIGFKFDEQIYYLVDVDPPNGLAAGQLEAGKHRLGFMLIQVPVRYGTQIRLGKAQMCYDDSDVSIN